MVTKQFSFSHRRQFFTSGLIRNMAEEDFIWESDGSRVAPEVQFWLSDAEKQKSGQYITYKYGGKRC